MGPLDYLENHCGNECTVYSEDKGFLPDALPTGDSMENVSLHIMAWYSEAFKVIPKKESLGRLEASCIREGIALTAILNCINCQVEKNQPQAP